MPKLTAEELEFRRGVALALSTLNACHDQPSMCADVMIELDLTLAKFRPLNLTDYDLTSLRVIEECRVRRLASRRRRAAQR